MRRYLFFLLTLAAGIFLQLIFSLQFNPLRIQPDFLLVVFIFLIFYSNYKEAAAVAIIAGFLKDSFSIGIFGSHIFIFLVCAVLLEQYKRYIYREDLRLKVILVFLVSLVSGFLNYAFVLSRLSVSFFSAFFLVIIPEAVFTTAVSPLLFWLMRRCALKYSI